MQVQKWRATRKATELIKLVTHSNNINTKYTNLAYTHTHTQTHNVTENYKEKTSTAARFSKIHQLFNSVNTFF